MGQTEYLKLNKPSSEDAITAADVTGDGVVDRFDRNKIFQHIRGEQRITQVIQG